MTAYERISQLKKDRLEFIRIAKANKMFEGIVTILSDMYPDTAHFIYELLQNAEDMSATEVKFILDRNRLVFEHNGRKRDFIIEDIDSITSIGNNQLKKDDATSIGKFGVGFKAVFTYTKTPEIHSGEYDFRIRDMFVPDPDGVPKTSKKGYTQFIFPFDHDKKTPVKAVEEIKDSLLQLDENSVLFLRNIKQIMFKLPDNKMGGVKIEDRDNVLKRIIRVNAITGQKTSTYWSKFTKEIEVSTGDKVVQCPVSIAYKMIKKEEILKVDSALNGNVCIYFPAVKEKSHLRFHINAPFASTVARDSVRVCEENKKLVAGIADLVIASLYYFRDSKTLGAEFYELMPIKRDFENDLNSIYRPIYTKIISEFKSAQLIIDDKGDYHKVDEVMQTNREIVKLFTSDDILSLYKKTWIPSVGVQARAAFFFDELGIQKFDRRNIADTLVWKSYFYDSIFKIKNEENNVEWFKEFYALMHDVQGINSILNDLKKVVMIKCLDGKLHSANDKVYIRASSYKPKHIVNPIFVDLGLITSNTINEKAQRFLVEMLKVPLLTEQVDIMAGIDKESVSEEDFQAAAVELVESYKKNKSVDAFKGKQIFYGRSGLNQNDTENYILTAEECCFSKEVYFFYRDTDAKYILAVDDYRRIFNTEDFNIFCEIFRLLGGKILPSIYRKDITWRHPQYSQINTVGENQRTCIKDDYYFNGVERLDEIHIKELYQESLLLWNMVVMDKNINHHIARYKANARQNITEYESTAAYFLRRKAWIPNKNGEFKRPCDMTKEDLPAEFIYTENAVFLKNLGFGDPSKGPNDMAAILKNAGLKISKTDEQWFCMSEEEKAEFLAFREAKRERERKLLSLEEALERENHEQEGFEDFDDYGRDIGLKNPTKRQKKLEEDFEKSLLGNQKVHKTWRYVAPAKSSALEKQFVKEQYHGKCQICDKSIRKFNGDVYFEAINIINTSLLDDKYKNLLQAGWNTLSLCPNCAAEYRHCAKNLSDFEQQVQNVSNETLQRNSLIDIYISLKGQAISIKFTPRHLLALQIAFKTFMESEE